LTTCWPGVSEVSNVLADGLDANPLDEAPGDFEIDVGFEKSHAHFAQSLLTFPRRPTATGAGRRFR
jgi:hypothetical protein